MKESEAKTKWCPHVRIAFPETSGNRDMDSSNNPIYNCIGSGCMMWESWEYESAPDINSPVTTKLKGEGDCGLKTRELECNGC
jgi:hypothetical protein